jgi:hypothetical protein
MNIYPDLQDTTRHPLVTKRSGENMENIQVLDQDSMFKASIRYACSELFPEEVSNPRDHLQGVRIFPVSPTLKEHFHTTFACNPQDDDNIHG